MFRMDFLLRRFSRNADYIISIGQIVFLLALLPSLLTDEKPELWTSVFTSLMLYVFAVTQFSINLRWAALSNLVLASAWLALALQVL